MIQPEENIGQNKRIGGDSETERNPEQSFGAEFILQQPT